jgi:hypothetical protein
MKRLLAALVLAGAALALVLLSHRTPGWQHALESAAKAGPGQEIVLADLTNFAWERAFVFAPYTTRADVEEALGFPWPNFDSRIETRGDVVLLVFERAGRVVEHLDLRRLPADLAPAAAAGRSGLSRAAARFVVGEGGTLSLARQ